MQSLTNYRCIGTSINTQMNQSTLHLSIDFKITQGESIQVSHKFHSVLSAHCEIPSSLQLLQTTLNPINHFFKEANVSLSLLKCVFTI